MRIGPRFAPFVLVAFAALDACATTDTASTTTQTASTDQAPRRRRRRHRNPDSSGAPSDVATMPTTTSDSSASPAPDGQSGTSGSLTANSAFGSPVVQQPAGEVHVEPHWYVEDGRGHIECDGNDERPVPPPSPQCPQEPSNASIVRAFIPLEHDVLECGPPANANGRLPMHVVFGPAGYPLTVSFPGVRVLRRTATCMGRALCNARVPNFRAAESAVDYEYVVLVPTSE